jgi:hypothetical protein
VIDGTIGKLVLQGDQPGAEAALSRALAERVVHENAAIDLVALPASEDDLTLAGLASIAGADLVLTDPASNALARRFARRDAEMGMLDDASDWLERVRATSSSGRSICVLAHSDALVAYARTLANERLNVRYVGTLQ